MGASLSYFYMGVEAPRHISSMASHIVTRRCAGEILPYSWQEARQQRREDSRFAFATMPRGVGDAKERGYAVRRYPRSFGSWA